MKVEIWSDVACPFCYIGKRRFEEALEQFEGKEQVEVEWKSFQLNPDLKPKSEQNIYAYLAEAKGWTVDYAREVSKQVCDMAESVGLHYNMDQTIVANTADAHRLIQMAKSKGLGDAMEEQLFQAYFIQGKNVGDHATLIRLATDAGLNAEDAAETLNSNAFADAVELDAYEGSQLGVSGVPSFVFDRKYGISGAQPLEVFKGTLMQTYQETEK